MSVLVGTTKKCAVELSNRISMKSYSFDEKYPMDNFDRIIHHGGLYAGGVKGLKETLPRIKNTCKQFIIVTVGLADPEMNRILEISDVLYKSRFLKRFLIKALCSI